MINKILEKTIEMIQSKMIYYDNISTGEDFEKIVLESLRSADLSTIILDVDDNGKHAFPDIRIQTMDKKWFGLEVKYSNTGHWHSLGNSVFEGVKSKEEASFKYEDIYLIFGRKPSLKEDLQHIEVKVDLYTNVLKNIEVTHSPRFSIDMNLKTASVFNEGEMGYYSFRKKTNEEKVKFLKTYFKQNITANRWYTQEDTNTEIAPLLINEMDDNLKEQIMTEAYILFPNDLFSSSSSKYFEVARYFMSEHFCFSSSLRDIFSARGRGKFGGNNFSYSRVIYNFYDLTIKINKILENENSDFVNKCQKEWKKVNGFEYNGVLSLKENYLILLDTISDKIVIDSDFERINKAKVPMLSEIYSCGLSEFS